MAGRRTDDTAVLGVTWTLDASSRVWVGGHNLNARTELERHLLEVSRPPEGPLDVAFITPNAPDEAVYFAGKLRTRLALGASLWVVLPLSHAPHAAEFNGSRDDLIVGMFERGFAEAGTATIGDGYTAIGFRPDDPFA